MRQATFPFSHYRPHVDTPEVLPDVDTEVLENLDGFLNKNNLVVLDDVTASYRYGRKMDSASVHSLMSYIGYKSLRQFFTQYIAGYPKEAQIIDLLLDLESRSRQVLHIAENLEANLGMFYGLALMRQRALATNLEHLSQTGELAEDLYTRHCADAIVDFGQSMAEPKTIPSPHMRNRKYDHQLPQDVQGFGMYAHEKDRSVLGSDAGQLIMSVVGNEQDRRIRTFRPRYEAVISVIGTQIPSQNISPDMTDEQLLCIEFSLPDKVSE